MLLETDKEILGKKFRQYRKFKNMTQFQLAEKVGLNEKQISRIEIGQNHPTYITFAKLIEVLDIDIEEFCVDKKAELNKAQEDLIHLIKNSSGFELKIYSDIIRVLKKDLKNIPV